MLVLLTTTIAPVQGNLPLAPRLTFRKKEKGEKGRNPIRYFGGMAYSKCLKLDHQLGEKGVSGDVQLWHQPALRRLITWYQTSFFRLGKGPGKGRGGFGHGKAKGTEGGENGKGKRRAII